VTFLNLRDDSFVVVAKIRCLAGEQDIHDDAKAPHVRLFIILLLIEDLWCHVEGGPNHLAQLLALRELASGSEIDQLDRLVVIEADILWLQVSVDEALLVEVVD